MPDRKQANDDTFNQGDCRVLWIEPRRIGGIRRRCASARPGPGKPGNNHIYGGTTKGLMGVVADAALDAGGKVHGVITEGLHQRGQSHSGLTRHEIALTLRSRKERMVEIADAFIALPGGIGTIEELMEVWTMNQLSEIDKPVGLLNTAGFFAAFLRVHRPYGRDEIPAGGPSAFDIRGCRRECLDRQASPLSPVSMCPNGSSEIVHPCTRRLDYG